MSQSKTTVRDLRRQNRQSILRQSYFAQPVSRLELSQQLGLSPATITNVVAELLEEGLLIETGVEESQGGRPRTLLTINPSYGYFIGVDVGETQTQIELFDIQLHRLAGMSYAIQATAGTAEQILAHIDAGVKALLEQADIARKQVLGVGVGVPGIVERAEQPLVHAPLWGWTGLPLQAQLRERLTLPVLIDNGAKAQAQAELWFGAGRSVESLAVLLIGTGVGAGIITDGRLYRGATNSAGEWGHTKIVLDGWACRCGSNGCLEAYIGAPGIVRHMREMLPDEVIPEDQQQAIDMLLALVDAGNPTAAHVLDTTARYLGAGIANLINLFNPRLIVLGGWVGISLGSRILEAVKSYATASALRQPFDVVRLGLCELGLDAVCKGAASIVLEAFLNGRLSERVAEPLSQSRVPAALSPLNIP